MHEQKNKPTTFTLKDQLLLNMINNDNMNIEMNCDVESQEDTNSKGCLKRVCFNLNERLKGYIEKVNILEELWLIHESKQNEMKYDKMHNENNMNELFKFDSNFGDSIESKNANLLPFLQQANDNLFAYHNYCKRYPLDLTDFNLFLMNYKRRHESRTKLIRELKRENTRLKAYSRDLYDRFKSIAGKSESIYESFSTNSNLENHNKEIYKENEFTECNNSLVSFYEDKINKHMKLNNGNNLETIYDKHMNKNIQNKHIMDSTANIKMNISMLQSHLKVLKSSEKDSGFQRSSSCHLHQCSDDNLTDNCEHLSTCVDNEANININKETNLDNSVIANHDRNINESSKILERKIKARENVNFELSTEVVELKNQLIESEKYIKERNISIYYLQNELEQKTETIYELNSEIEALSIIINNNLSESNNCNQMKFDNTDNKKVRSLQYMLNDFIQQHNMLKTELESKCETNTKSVNDLKNQLEEASSFLHERNQLEEELELLKKDNEALLLKYSESIKLSNDYKLKYENDLKIISDYDTLIKSLKEEIHFSKEQHEANLKSLSEVSNLHRENYETTLKSLNDIEIKNKNLDESLNRLNIDNENLKELVYLNSEQNKSNNLSLEADVKLLKAENEDLRSNKFNLNEQIKKLELELVNYEEENFRVENMIAILKEENNKSFQKMNNMELELNKFISDNESLKANNLKLTRDIVKLNTKIKINDKLTIENKLLLDNNKKLTGDLSQVGEDLGLREDELRKICLQFESAKLELLKVNNELKDQKFKFDKLIIDSNSNIKNKEQEIQLLNSRIKDFEVNITQKDKYLADHDKIHRFLRKEIEVLTKNFQDSVNLKNKSDTELKNKMTEFECVKCSLETRNHNILAQKNDLMRQCEKLQHEINKYKQKLSNSDSENQKLMIENSHLLSQKLSAENNLELINLKTEIDILKTENSQLKNESKIKRVDVSQLTNNFNELWTKCDAITADFNRVNSQLLNLQAEHVNCGLLKEELYRLQTEHLYCTKLNNQLTELRLQHEQCSKLNSELCKLRTENEKLINFNNEFCKRQAENMNISPVYKKETADFIENKDDVKRSIEFDMLVSELEELKRYYSEGISIYAQQNKILRGVVQQLETKNSNLQEKLRLKDCAKNRTGCQKEKALQRANSFNCGDSVVEHKCVNDNKKNLCPNLFTDLSLNEFNKLDGDKNFSHICSNDKTLKYIGVHDDSKFLSKLMDKKYDPMKQNSNLKECQNDRKLKGRISRKLPIVRSEEAFF